MYDIFNVSLRVYSIISISNHVICESTSLRARNNINGSLKESRATLIRVVSTRGGTRYSAKGYALANSCQLQMRVLPRLYILFPRVNILGWFCSPLELEHIQINDITRARTPTVRVYVRDRET